ncbi:MAG: phage major capsid protein [Gammaproteobacteria bacterium]|nr:phage major capsid protein [Gammaproteobacteria bacterium]
MLTDEQKKELENDIQAIVDERVAKGVEEKLATEIVKRFAPKEPKIAVILDEADRPFMSLGEQLMAVKTAKLSDGRIMDARLKAPTGLSEGVPADGGFLVQTDFASMLLEKTFALSDLLSRVFKMPIGSNSNAIKIPAVSDASRADGSRFGGIRAYWMNEAGSKTASAPSFKQVALELKKLVGYTTCTDELLEDAPALESWIMQAFAREFDFKLADAIINGDGAGKPLGVMNSPCLVTVTAETGQGASTIVAENVIKMWARRFGTNYVWLINQDIEPQLYTMALAVGTGGIPVYMPAGGLSGSPYGTLFGKPVLPCEQCQTLGTAGDIILADLSQYVMISKGGMQSASSIHVNFQTDQTAFRFVYRCDGQPMWDTYLTPKNGTNYQSPFVVLNSTRD